MTRRAMQELDQDYLVEGQPKLTGLEVVVGAVVIASAGIVATAFVYALVYVALAI